MATEENCIRAIKHGDVHRITSGQVILDVQSAVKELIENALDAGATTIEVRFKEYGADLIEVSDNGSGVEEANYDALGLKHHTSKLRDFADLASVQTFGFRGEALSSLCELAKVQIVTATQAQDPLGTIIELNRDGSVGTCDRKIPRQRGTTVTATELFHTLPVRRSELLRNVRKEFAKVQALLQAYALIAKNVRWMVTNTVSGRKVSIMTTSSSAQEDFLLSNVKSVFGPKAGSQLIPLHLNVPLQSAHLRSFSRNLAYAEERDEELVDEDSDTTIVVRGLISRPAIGCGRTSSDRCFLYVNGRPWDAPKVVRAFNEVYRQFNIQQSPMVVADFAIKGDAYDVNVSPDKRTLFVHKEVELIERLKSQLEEALNPFQSHFKVNNTSPQKQPTLPFQRSDAPSVEEEEDQEEDMQTVESAWAEVDVRAFANGRRRRRSSSSAMEEEANLHATATVSPALKVARTADASIHTTLADADSRQRRAREVFLNAKAPPDPSQVTSRRSTRSADGRNSRSAPNLRSNLLAFMAPQSKPLPEEEIIGVGVDASPSPSFGMADDDVRSESIDAGDTECDTQMAEEEEPSPAVAVENHSSTPTSNTADDDSDISQTGSRPGAEDKIAWQEEGQAGTEQEAEAPRSTGSRRTTVAFDLTSIRETLSRHVRMKQSDRKEQGSASEHDDTSLAEGAAVEQTDAQTAEAALSRFIEKDDFGAMQIVGQFNLGFIIARLRQEQQDDLFIIDQHAADEKYNFEDLTETTKLHSQRLIVPRTLELSPADELIAVEHQEALTAHGFQVRFDQDASPGSRLTLMALPMTQRVSFGVEDLEELLHKLSDERPSGERARKTRCSKLRNVLASRACRKSIMIGTALTRERMQTVVGHLGTLVQPWNCPHGRPTMRHLYDLNRARSKNEENIEGRRTIDWRSLL